MPGKHRPLSTAEKKAEYARKNKSWPKYPDGTDQRWNKSTTCVEGGYFQGWQYVQADRKKLRELNALRMTQAGTCSAKECSRPKRQNSTGNYDTQCREHIRARGSTRVRLPSGLHPYFGAFAEVARQARDDYYRRSKNVA